MVLDVPLDRVKGLTSGRLKKLTPEETRRLVQTLNLSAHWLATGEGPMFNPTGGQKLGEMLTQLRLTAAHLASLGIDGDTASAVMSIIHGVSFDDAESIKAGVVQAVWSSHSPDERALLESYRRCSDEGKINLVQTAALLAAGLKATAANAPKRAAKPAPETSTQIEGEANDVKSTHHRVKVMGNNNKVMTLTRK